MILKFDVPFYFRNQKLLEFKKNSNYKKYHLLYIIIRHLFPELTGVKDNYIPLRYIKKFNLKNISFPITFNGLQKLIKQNKHLPLKVNVLCDSEGTVTNLGKITNIKHSLTGSHTLHLLMFKKDRTIDTVEPLFQELSDRQSKNSKVNDVCQIHFFNKINNVQKLLNYREWKLTNVNNSSRNFYCENCFLRFRSKTKKEKHFISCNSIDKQHLSYPQKGASLKFKNLTHSFKAPVIGFCDFESVLQRNCERQHCKKCNKEECECNVSKTEDINAHRPVGYSILFVDLHDKVFFQEEYAGEDCVKHFYERLSSYQTIVETHKQTFRKVSQMKASSKDWKLYHKAKTCHICKLPFGNDWKLKKVVDHDHVSGKMEGAAHSICNLQRSGPYRTPVFFHNAQG